MKEFSLKRNEQANLNGRGSKRGERAGPRFLALECG